MEIRKCGEIDENGEIFLGKVVDRQDFLLPVCLCKAASIFANRQNIIYDSFPVNYGEHVGGNGLMTLGLKSEKRHRVPVRTHCEVWREFVQVVTERQMVEKEVRMLSGRDVA